MVMGHGTGSVFVYVYVLCRLDKRCIHDSQSNTMTARIEMSIHFGSTWLAYIRQSAGKSGTENDRL